MKTGGLSMNEYPVSICTAFAAFQTIRLTEFTRVIDEFHHTTSFCDLLL